MKRFIATALVVAAMGCSEAIVQPPSPPPVQPPPPPPPPPPSAFGIFPALYTVEAGGWVTFVAERADSTVDAWVTSDPNAAPVLERARGWAAVSARAPGTFTVKAVRGADSGLATLVVLPLPGPDPSGDWEAIDLGLLDAFQGTPTAIDDNGTVVGSLMQTTHNPVGRGFIYKDGVMRKLSRYGDHDHPSAIGPSGEIVGYESDGVLVWDDADAAPRLLPPPSYFDTGILDVNARGDILATLGSYLGLLRAVVWRNDIPQALPALNNSVQRPHTYARAWNSRGQIVGGSVVEQWSDRGDKYSYFHPFIWQDGVMRDLGVLAPLPCPSGVPVTDCSDGEATGINSDGVIVGTSTDAEGRTRAVIWENGIMRDLGVFPGHSTAALAINDRGQVLGTLGRSFDDDTAFFWDNGQVQIVFTGDAARETVLGPGGEVVGTMMIGGRPHAFIWQAGHMTDLGVGSPVAINSRGEIIGTRGSFPTLWRRKR